MTNRQHFDLRPGAHHTFEPLWHWFLYHILGWTLPGPTFRMAFDDIDDLDGHIIVDAINPALERSGMQEQLEAAGYEIDDDDDDDEGMRH